MTDQPRTEIRVTKMFRTERDELLAEVETWRDGYNKRGEMLGDLRDLYDELRAENERLRAGLQGYIERGGEQSAEIERLRAQVERLRAVLDEIATADDE